MPEEHDIWFSGPISDAISLVNQRNCVLLVYIHDDSEKAQTLNVTLKDEHVIATIKENAIALSMEKNSENATLFGQFYPIQAVPIVYFIKQGTIRDFGIETITSEEIVEKIIQLNEFVTPQASPVNNPLSEQPTQSHVVDVPSISVDTAAPTVPSVNTTTPSIPSVAASSSDTKEAKTKKEELQKQLEKLRKERAERDKQDAKEREIKRRQEAKLLQEAKQDRIDKENKKYFDRIKKERLEDEAHRKKVRDQIAKDRAEKIASRNAEKQRSSPEISAVPSNIEHANNTINLNHNYSNLNIRQLDGTNLRNKFKASDTLSTVREWINQNRTDDKRKTFKLSSQFPTRLFTKQDDDTTLTNLNLCPSATIIMKPLKPSRTSNNQLDMISYTFNTIYGFFFALIKLITGIFTTLFPTNRQQIQPQQQQQQQQQQPLFRNLKGGQRLGGESSSTPPAVEPTIKKRNPYATRVNTLEEEDDEDEKRSTYNGNSVNHE